MKYSLTWDQEPSKCIDRRHDEMAPDMSSELDFRCDQPSVQAQSDHLLTGSDRKCLSSHPALGIVLKVRGGCNVTLSRGIKNTWCLGSYFNFHPWQLAQCLYLLKMHGCVRKSEVTT